MGLVFLLCFNFFTGEKVGGFPKNAWICRPLEKETREVIIKEVGGGGLKTFLKFLYTAHVTSEEMNEN